MKLPQRNHKVATNLDDQHRIADLKSQRGDFMPEWKRVDVFDISEKVIDENLSIYREARKKSCAPFEGYIEAALSSENHLAFACEFIDTFIKSGEYGLPYEELMSLAERKVEEYLNQNGAGISSRKRRLSKEQIKTAKMHSKLQASYYMKDTAWRSPTCVYPLERSSQKKGSAASETEQLSGRKVLYSAEGRKKWKDNTRIKRDVLVQHAFVMGLNADETDELLMRAGYPGLYPLDAIDACAIINLNEYAGRLDLSPYEVLWKVKNDINDILLHLDGPGIVFVDKGTADGARMGVLTSAAGRYIDKELQELRKILNKQSVSTLPTAVGLTKFLTRYYSERIGNVHDVAEYFHDSGIDANAIFTQRYYGFLKKTKEYLYDWRRYRKNLIPCTWELTLGFAAHDFRSDRRFKLDKAVYDCSVSAILKKLQDSEENNGREEAALLRNPIDTDLKKAKPDAYQVDSDEYYEDCLRLIQYVRTYDVLDQDVGLIYFKPNKKDRFTYGRVLLEGEKKHFKGADSIEFGESGSSVMGYVYEMKKKHDVVRFALSAGREEELGEYLMLARYWKRNWYREISGGKTVSECEAEGFYPDPIDKLVIYALLYRDKLIEKWCADKANGRVARIRIRDVFPLRELILEISYDISFAYMYGICHIHKVSAASIEELNEIYTGFDNLRQNMIFPVQWKGRSGEMLTYDRDQATYKSGRKAPSGKEDTER